MAAGARPRPDLDGAGEHRHTVVDGVRLHAWSTGDARRGHVLLVPGLAVSFYLRPAAVALARRGYRAWVLDPPGFGASADGPRRVLDVPTMARFVGRWLAAVDLRVAAAVGQSMGTQVVAHVAAALPDRVGSCVLQGPVVDPVQRTVPRSLLGWVRDAPREDPAMGRTQVPEWRRAGVRRMAGTLRATLDDRLEETLERVRQPVLVVLGRRDPLARASWAASLVGDRPERRLVLVPGAHCVPWRDPEGFAGLAVAFVEAR